MRKKRAKIQLLVIDFCNIKNWNHDELLTLQKKYGVIYTLAGEKNGFEKFCYTIRDNKKRRFYLIEDKEVKDFKTDFESELKADQKPFIILPSESKTSELWHFLEKSQKLYMNFLRNCSKGILDIDFINKMFVELKYVSLKFIEGSEKFESKITYEVKYLDNIESYINWDILTLFFDGLGGAILPYIKQCERCEKFYVAKIKRSDQKYCPVCSKHRSDRTSKTREEWNKYHRNRRKKIAETRKKEKIKELMVNLNISEKEAMQLYEDDQNM